MPPYSGEAPPAAREYLAFADAIRRYHGLDGARPATSELVSVTRTQDQGPAVNFVTATVVEGWEGPEVVGYGLRCLTDLIQRNHGAWAWCWQRAVRVLEDRGWWKGEGEVDPYASHCVLSVKEGVCVR